MTISLFRGLATGLTLICAIGAQNAFVLRQGLRGEHLGPVVITCVASDILLIACGVAGLGATCAAHPAALASARWIGAAFLVGYGLLAAGRALRPAALTPAERPSAGLGLTLLACLGFTYLNPHTYLDTVLVLGTVANADPRPWTFAAGAMVASGLWFASLAFGARRLASPLARPSAWRVLDGGIAAVMTAVAVALVRG